MIHKLKSPGHSRAGHGLLLERAEVPDGECVEQGDAGDGGHGRHGEIVHHRVRHDALREPLPAHAHRRLRHRTFGPGRRHDRQGRGHLVVT